MESVAEAVPGPRAATGAAGVAAPLDDVSGPASQRLALVVTLCARLRAANVVYCHWKSNDALHLSASGENDLDLLVDRRCLQDFLAVLADCGFKQAKPPRRRQVPGVLHFYGLDHETGRLVHVDAQAQLVLGDDTTKNVRLPIERAYLDSCVDGFLFPVPAAEFELAVLVVRLALKHATWDAAAFGLGPLRPSERRELSFLEARSDPAELRRVVEEHLPQVGWQVWSEYFRTLMDDASLRRRVLAGRRVVSAVSVFMRRPPVQDSVLRCWRRVEWGVRHYAFGQRNTKRPQAGGSVIAVVGGDGAGKSTLVSHLAEWLNGPLDTRTVHMGKPSPSLGTLIVKGSVLAGRRTGLLRGWLPTYPSSDATAPGTGWLAWQVVTARDRLRQHRRARSLAGRGYLVICDRFPLADVRLMDGARTRWVSPEGLSPLQRRLVAVEQRCYASIRDPDLLLVLRVDPDIAVVRKRGVDPADFVRARSAEIFTADWSAAGAVVIDASRSADEVLAEARSLVWQAL